MTFADFPLPGCQCSGGSGEIVGGGDKEELGDRGGLCFLGSSLENVVFAFPASSLVLFVPFGQDDDILFSSVDAATVFLSTGTTALSTLPGEVFSGIGPATTTF